MSLSYFADTETYTRWEVNHALPTQLVCRPQTSWNQKTDADGHLPHHQPNQKNVHELITPSENHQYEASHYPLQVGTQF